MKTKLIVGATAFALAVSGAGVAFAEETSSKRTQAEIKDARLKAEVRKEAVEVRREKRWFAPTFPVRRDESKACRWPSIIREWRH